MTWAIFILIGWVGFWAIWGTPIFAKAGEARRAFNLTVIAAWLLMLALVGLLSPPRPSFDDVEYMENDEWPYAR